MSPPTARPTKYRSSAEGMMNEGGLERHREKKNRRKQQSRRSSQSLFHFYIFFVFSFARSNFLPRWKITFENWRFVTQEIKSKFIAVGKSLNSSKLLWTTASLGAVFKYGGTTWMMNNSRGKICPIMKSTEFAQPRKRNNNADLLTKPMKSSEIREI